MKFSSCILLPVFGFFATTFASPVASDAVVKRANTTNEVTILSGLITSVKQQTASINATLAALPANPDALTKQVASNAVNAALKQITNQITAATTQVKGLPVNVPVNLPNVSGLPALPVKRQIPDVGTIASDIAALLLELTSTLNAVIAALGLTSLLSMLTPLTTALSGLITAVQQVVDGLVTSVVGLLDGVLTGLAAALANLGGM